MISAAAPPDKLYAGRPGVTEAFEFDRTVSRLIEMQSREWLDGWAERRGKTPRCRGLGCLLADNTGRKRP